MESREDESSLDGMKWERRSILVLPNGTPRMFGDRM